MLLPKTTYRKLRKRLEQIQQNWSKDAQTASIPYCVRASLEDAIDHLITQDRVHVMGRTRRELISETIEYLVAQNIVSRPEPGSTLYPVGNAALLPDRFKPSVHIQSIRKQLEN